MIDKPFHLKIKNATTGTTRGSRFVTLHEAIFVGALEMQEFIGRKEPAGIVIKSDKFTEPIYSATTRNGKTEYLTMESEYLFIMKQEIQFYKEIFNINEALYITEEIKKDLQIE